jgi:hypothetical protein
MSKVLITSGCSFTESKYSWSDPTDRTGTKTWALYLGRYLQNFNYDFINKAMGSQGNGLISRGIIYQVTEELKTRNPEDILVGIMWSGVDRHDYRCENPELTNFALNKIYNGWMENPTGFIGDIKKWIVMNGHWSSPDNDGKVNEEAYLYYKHFHDIVGSYIYSLEHMLRVQYFLKNLNIKYFFTIYQDHVFEPKYINHNEVKYLYKLLDKNQFLPVTSEYTWCVESKVAEEHWILPHPANHPHSLHHQAFTEQVIIPWLKNKSYI